MRRLALALSFFAVFLLAVGVSAAVFTESFTGAPPSPVPFSSSHWEIALHTQEDSEGSVSLAQHGADCSSPGDLGTNVHLTSTFADLAFQCANHMMTHVPGDDGSYSVMYATPDQMLDLSNGSGTIRFDVSTLSTSTRDWIDVWVQPWETQEQRPISAASFTPTNLGNPRNGVHLEMGAGCTGFDSGTGQFHVQTFDGNRNLTACLGPDTWDAGWLKVLTPSAVTRSTIEITFTPGHIKVWMPNNGGLVLVEDNIPALAFTQGIVSFGHHSYSPEKGANPSCDSCGGKANTWHWDEISLSPSIPFTILNTDHRTANYAASPADRTFSWGTPAPANSVLRFTAQSGDGATPATVSFNGGASVNATRMSDSGAFEHPASWLVTVPVGATNALIAMTPYGNHGDIQHPTIFSRTTGAPTPTATPTASPTVTPTASPSPTATPTASPSPTASPTPTPTASPTASPTVTPTPVATPCRVQVRKNGATGSWVYDTAKGSYEGTLILGECRR
jgi:hypothetical protein